MLRRIFLTIAFLVIAVGFVSSETIYCIITKVEGNKVTYKKFVKGKPAQIFDAKTAETVKDVAVEQTTKDKKKSENIKDGLANPMFKNIEGNKLKGWITIADDGDDKGKITDVSIRLPIFGD